MGLRASAISEVLDVEHGSGPLPHLATAEPEWMLLGRLVQEPMPPLPSWVRMSGRIVGEWAVTHDRWSR